MKLTSVVAVFQLKREMTHPVFVQARPSMPSFQDYPINLELTRKQATDLIRQLKSAVAEADRTELLTLEKEAQS